MTPETPADEGPPPPPLADADTVERFHASYVVDPQTGCWIGKGKPGTEGYSRFRVGSREWLAHRFAYTLRHGPIPEGLNVLHGCDNRRCYNWDHLRVGTQRDNAQDAKERDRLRIGPGSNPRKLTGRDAVAIQGMRWFEKLTLPQLAEAFNVSVWTIKAVLSGKARVAAAEAHIDAVLAAKAEARARAAPETTEAETVP